MTPESLVPVGSLTKAFTGVGVLRLIEEGKVGWNDTIDMHVNDFLKKANGSTIQDVWLGDPMINTVTIY